MKNRTMQYGLIVVFVILSSNMFAQWTQKGADIYGQASQDLYGSSIAMSQDGFVMAIGAPEHSSINGEVGMVRVMEWNGTDWVQRGQDIVGDVEWNKFGKSVSLSGDGMVLAIGAPGENNLNNTSISRVKTYSWNGTNWIQIGTELSDGFDNREFGASVSLSLDASRLAIGAPYDGMGLAKTYEWNGTDWVQLGTTLTAGPNVVGFGLSLDYSADGQHLAVGCTFEGTNNPGTVRTFDWDGNDWVQFGGNLVGSENFGQFGYRVSFAQNDTLLAISARRDDSGGNDAGRVIVYSKNQGSWQMYGTELYGESPNDLFGTSLSLSEDGSRLAVGAVFNNTNGIGSGHVKTFNWDGSDWQSFGNAIGGDGPSDQCGTAVAVSANGKVIAVGAPLNDGNWTDAGQVRVYEDGIQGLNLLNETTLLAYPNPVNEVLHIAGIEGEQTTYSIVDLAGREVLNGVLNTQNAIEVSALKEGVYTLQLEKEGKLLIKVFVKG